jgi:hypothetical protein
MIDVVLRVMYFVVDEAIVAKMKFSKDGEYMHNGKKF